MTLTHPHALVGQDAQTDRRTDGRVDRRIDGRKDGGDAGGEAISHTSRKPSRRISGLEDTPERGVSSRLARRLQRSATPRAYSRSSIRMGILRRRLPVAW